jgi:hypothetical protein
MNFTMRVGCAAVLAVYVGHAQIPYVNKKLKDRQVSIRKVVVFPAQASFDIVGAKGSEGGLPEADRIGADFTTAVAGELSWRGVQVLPSPWDQAKDDATRYARADLQGKYDNIAVQLRRKPDWVRKGKITMGDRVTGLDGGPDADALVFTRGSGHTLTPGGKAVALATWNLASVAGQFRGEVTMVDAKTGEVLVYVRFWRHQNVTERTGERLSKSLREAFHDVPLPLPPHK